MLPLYIGSKALLSINPLARTLSKNSNGLRLSNFALANSGANSKPRRLDPPPARYKQWLDPWMAIPTTLGIRPQQVVCSTRERPLPGIRASILFVDGTEICGLEGGHGGPSHPHSTCQRQFDQFRR